MSIKRIFLILVGLFVVIQFVPVERSTPPVKSELPAPDTVRAIFARSCFDCHSHQTKWPWYSYVAPVSWLVAKDVREGRRHLNMSDWERYDPKKKAKKIEEILEEIEEGNMPLKPYLWLHPEAKLSAGEIRIIKDWVLRQVPSAEAAGDESF